MAGNGFVSDQERGRRVDDERIRHIQTEITEVDRRLVAVETRQEAFERQAAEAHRHMDQKIDGVRSTIHDVDAKLERHFEQENNDRKVFSRWLAGIFLAILLLLFEQFIIGGILGNQAKQHSHAASPVAPHTHPND